MTTGSVAYIVSVYHRLFPERQIYHRCNGQVHFTTVSGRAQALGVFVGCMVLGWVAYSSVNVMFTEQITARMEVNLRESKRRWEGELHDVLVDYERLQAGVAVVKDQLDTSLRELEERQRQVDTVLEKKSSVLDLRAQELQRTAKAVFVPPEADPHTSVSILNGHDDDPTPRVSRPAAMTSVAQVEGLSNVLRSVAGDTSTVAPDMEKQIALIEDLEVRVARLQSTQYDDLVSLEELVTDDIGRLERALGSTGYGYDRLVDAFQTALEDGDETSGQGGPFISAAANAEALTSDDIEGHVFARKTFRIQTKLRRLAALRDALNALPVTRPVAAYRITSGFGTRPDPFTGRIGMHYGLDIAGRRGTPVQATAAGKVAFAGTNGGYGRMVRIDHGNGLVTVYAHLHKITAKRGQRVVRGDVIGTLGSSGRSTAPHLHYEIKHGKDPIDPRKFFEAGQYVFENQG